MKSFIILLSLSYFLFPAAGYAVYNLYPPVCSWKNKSGVSSEDKNIFYCNTNTSYDFKPLASHRLSLKCGNKGISRCTPGYHGSHLTHPKSLRLSANDTYGSRHTLLSTNWKVYTQKLTVNRIYCRLVEVRHNDKHHKHRFTIYPCFDEKPVDPEKPIINPK